MKYAKIELFYKNKRQSGYIENPEKISFSGLMDGLEPGDDSYRISVVEMTEEEYEALPEYLGP